MATIDSVENYRSSKFTAPWGDELDVLVDKDDTVWFRAPDLLKMLGLPLRTTSRIKADDKRIIKDMGHRGFGTSYVNEPGMNLLIFASKKKEAMKVKEWIARDVLPSIRKSGGYILGQESLSAADRAELDETIKQLREEVRIRTEENDRANAGKLKLQNLLIQEEDRNFETNAELAKTRAEKDALERRLRAIGEYFSKPENVKEYLKKLEYVCAFDARKAEFLEMDRLAAREESRIYAQIRPSNPDPIVIDADGLLGTRSEMLERDCA